MAVSEVLEMVFSNQGGREVILRVRQPKSELTVEEITAVMDDIIARNIFTTSGGDLIAKKDVRTVTATVTDLWDPS